MRVASWNVNGLRNLSGFPAWLQNVDIACLQEIRAEPHQLDLSLRAVAGYHAYFAPGSGGTAIYSRQRPDSVQMGLGLVRFDCEGRALTAHYGALAVVCVYVPSGANGRSNWFYKLAFLFHLLDYVVGLLAEGKTVILCGDFNIAHQELDLVRPVRVTGFTAEERDWISELLERGFVDTFRVVHPQQGGAYTWWSQREGMRAQNKGWRMDYIFASADLPILDAAIHPDVLGSDHCPVTCSVGGF